MKLSTIKSDVNQFYFLGIGAFSLREWFMRTLGFEMVRPFTAVDIIF